jgi:hypothetical protein
MFKEENYKNMPYLPNPTMFMIMKKKIKIKIMIKNYEQFI